MPLLAESPNKMWEGLQRVQRAYDQWLKETISWLCKPRKDTSKAPLILYIYILESGFVSREIVIALSSSIILVFAFSILSGLHSSRFYQQNVFLSSHGVVR